MKIISIALTDAEVKGITEYLEKVGEMENVKRRDIEDYISGVVSTTLNHPRDAVSDYISKYKNKQP